MSRRSALAGVPVASALALTLALALTGCVPNGIKSVGTIIVSASETSCTVSPATARSGAVSFSIANTGVDATELEILGSDKEQVIGEKENIGPGVSAHYVAELSPGTYYVGCKPGMTGDVVGTTKLVVSSSAHTVTLNASDTKARAAAVTNYVSYVKDQVGQLVSGTTTFVTAFQAGNNVAAKALYPITRAHYERIEPLAEKFPALDAELDLRQADLSPGDTWTGWHLIERDLWPPASGYQAMTSAERAAAGAQLNSTTAKLAELLTSASFTVTLTDVSNGADALMAEVAKSKITGEEEIWSHTDLWDFQANVEGAQAAYANVRDIALSKGAKGAKLVAEIDGDFARIVKALARYGSIATGYPDYRDLTTAQVKQLSDQVNALAEPLSRLTAIIVA